MFCLARQSARLVQTSANTMATASRIDLSGVYPPIVTPFNQDESIAWDKLKSNISKWNQHPITGFLVHGSNGEFCYLNTKERVEVIKAVKENVGPGKRNIDLL